MSDPVAPDTGYRRAEGDLILVFNCGSSSIKFALFDAGRSPLSRIPEWGGKINGIGSAACTYAETGLAAHQLHLAPDQPYRAGLAHIRARMKQRLGGRALAAVVHRVVHGGSEHLAPARVDYALLAELKSFIALAPLHQPFALEAIEALLAENPELPQVACFDTAFHHTLPAVEHMLPLPHAVCDHVLRRYGFHGLSYEYLTLALKARHGARAEGRMICAHLGSGASLCALNGLASVATTMGFSALDGLMMGTRSGAIDPGVLLYLMETRGYTPGQLAHLLYHDSGLLGVSGLSAEPRVLLANEERDDEVGARARAALALYIRRIVREIGALVAVLGGLDILVFTAGVGEHSAPIRQRVCRDLGFLGIALDDAANQDNAPVISAGSSPVLVGVEPTNEEWIAARHAHALMAHQAGGAPPRSSP